MGNRTCQESTKHPSPSQEHRQGGFKSPSSQTTTLQGSGDRTRQSPSCSATSSSVVLHQKMLTCLSPWRTDLLNAIFHLSFLKYLSCCLRCVRWSSCSASSTLWCNEYLPLSHNDLNTSVMGSVKVSCTAASTENEEAEREPICVETF